MKKLFIIFSLILLVLPLASAFGYDNAVITTNINYSLVNTNNTYFWQGYIPATFSAWLETNYKWGYNMTAPAMIYEYNQTTPAITYCDTMASSNNASWLATFNVTYNKWAYNQTYSGSTYNFTYDSYKALIDNKVNKTGDTMNGTLYITGVPPIDNFADAEVNLTITNGGFFLKGKEGYDITPPIPFFVEMAGGWGGDNPGYAFKGQSANITTGDGGRNTGESVGTGGDAGDLYVTTGKGGNSNQLVSGRGGDIIFNLGIGGTTLLSGAVAPSGQFKVIGNVNVTGNNITNINYLNPDGNNLFIKGYTMISDTVEIAPWENLVVASDIDADFDLSTANSGVYSNSSTIHFRRSFGTHANPTAPVNVGGNWLSVGKISAQVYDNSSYKDTSLINFELDGNVSVGNTPGRITFATTPAGSSTTIRRMIINNNGSVMIGTRTATQRLDVNGSVNISGNIYVNNITSDWLFGKINSSDIQNVPSLWTTTYNITYDTHASNMTLHNETFHYNQTTPAINYTDTIVSTNNASWTSTYNSTYDAKNTSQWIRNNGDIYYQNTTNGRVGINTKTPQGSLEVNSTTDQSALILDAQSISGSLGFIIHAPLSTSVSDGKAFGFFATGDGLARGVFYTDGAYGIGSGNAARDTFISRSAVSTLRIDSNKAGGTGYLVVTGKTIIGAGSTVASTIGQHTFTVVGNVNLNNTLYVNNTSAKVGIGTPNPTDKLNVVGNVNITGNLTVGGTIYANNISSDSPLQLQNSGVTVVYINNSKMGIMTSTPTANLDVNGTCRISGNMSIANNLFVNETNVGIGTSTPATALHIHSSYGTPILKIDSEHEWDNPTIFLGDGSAYSLNIYTSLGTDSAYIDNLAGGGSLNLRNNVGGTPFGITITSTGVGINTASPSSTLQVNGTITTNLTGTGNAYACLTSTGILYRSALACA